MLYRPEKFGRIIFLFLGFLAYLLISVSSISAQNISGVINSYAQVLDLDTCTNQLLVNDSKGFFAGDRVLLIEMKGAIIDVTNSPNFGTVTDYARAGNYEFGDVAQVQGLVITLKDRIVRKYDIGVGSVQIVKVPRYSDPIVIDTLKAKPWDGFVGGIVVFEASGTVTLTGDINVTGDGFSGGRNSRNGSATANQTKLFYPAQSDSAANKGESIAAVNLSFGAGRGASSNGGGGGDGQNSGGGVSTYIRIHGIVRNAGTAGTIQLKWAQNVAGGAGNSTILRQDSYIKATRVN
ncbi:MAG: hypothetical protein WCH46_02800 [bacterium]